MDNHGSLLNRMVSVGDRLVAERDERQHFHGAYLRSTRAVLAEAAAGNFLDPAWAERWGLAFATLYMDAFDAWERGESAPGPWQVAFDATRDADLTPVHHSMLGINAHINYDLPQALVKVITDDEFDDPEVFARRAADHARVDAILVQRVPDEDRRIALVEEPGDRTLADRLLKPLNRAATRRLLKDGRRKVWANALLLSRARRRGPEAYDRTLRDLRVLCEERLEDLADPRFMMLRLARRGFGVELPDTGTH